MRGPAYVKEKKLSWSNQIKKKLDIKKVVLVPIPKTMAENAEHPGPPKR